MHNLAFYVFNNGKPEEALNLIREVVEGYRHYLPPNHNKILIALQELGTILWSMKRYSEAESVFHEVLTGYEITQGPDGKDTILTVANLANLLNKMGRPAACSTLLQRIIKSTMEKEGVAPLKLRQAALDCYNLGEYVLAESLLTRLLSEGFEVPGTHCHQARICLLTDRLAKAQEHVDLAWQYRSEAPSYIICRILWFKIAFAILTGTPAEIYHDRIKNALQKEDAFMDWSMNIVLTHIKHQISDYQFSFLSALVGALSAKQNIEKLNEYSEWINAKPEKI
jgi:tetratricopeptide (TPR) repeat protein